MIPKKIFWMLGYNNLAILLEQERRHWLMKTSKNKQIQNTLTGDLFQGQVDNIGSDVILESKKLPYKYDYIPNIKFDSSSPEKILEICNSAFPHSAMVNGLLFARITSTNFPYSINGRMEFNHYKLKFENAETCIIPFGASLSSDEVYADKWIRTTTPPTVFILNEETGKYMSPKQIPFADNVTNVVYYYPLSETLQPFGITNLGNGSYELSPVNNDNYIGYPLFWFTCDQSNIGSNLSFENNINASGKQIFFVSTPGNSSPYNGKIYTGLDDTDATPDGDESINYVIRCSCKPGLSFINSPEDCTKNIDPNSIKLINVSEQTEHTVKFICTEKDVITMSSGIPWKYINQNTYEIEMSYFDQNNINIDGNKPPLVSIFDIKFDSSIPFVNTSKDVGVAGVKMSVGNPTSDINERYPYNINKWEGLPEWMKDVDDNLVPEHMMMYAFHQPPTYDPDIPETMQGAGLLLDPGKRVSEFDDEGNPITDTNNMGRVYVISNDDIEYKNNANEDYPKPARTAARICDIPTSVMQLTGVKGLSPAPIVDKKYVRSEASYTVADKNRLYNTLVSKWVRPTALTQNNKAVWEELGFPNRFAFPGLETLEKVDMYEHNDFRIWENLNPMVDVTKISVERITNGGSGYKKNDQGVCVIGGYSFTYIVDEVIGNGLVTKISLSPDDRATHINLSNFNITEEYNGSSDEYGTSPTSGKGKGLKFKFHIDYDYYHSILPKRGEFHNDLFALVRENDGLYVYEFRIDNSAKELPKPGKWTKGMCISEYEVTSLNKKTGGIATPEAYINSMIPSVRDLPISMKVNNSDPTSIVTLQTSSFINIIDKAWTPVVPDMSSDDDIPENVVDMCKFCCDGILLASADERTEKSVQECLKKMNVLRFDSYVVWRWLNPDSKSNTDFEYGIIYRSFNNYFSTDSITMLPTNKLDCDNYVHTNGNTTVVWTVPNVGVMMWIYDPTYTKKENYYLDPETMELHITREEMTLDKIDIRSNDIGKTIPFTNEENNSMWNIMTNNPILVAETNMYPIYQQPGLKKIVTQNGPVPDGILCGNWRLVFPRVNSFKIKNDKTNTEWIPKKMQIIKGRDIQDIGNVYDSNGNDVSTKSIIVSESSNGVTLKAFNSVTKSWDKI